MPGGHIPPPGGRLVCSILEAARPFSVTVTEPAFGVVCRWGPQSWAGANILCRSPDCGAVLKRYGLEHCSLAVIGADKLPDNSGWAVMVTADFGSGYLDVVRATRLAADLRRVGGRFLAERLSMAVKTAQKQMRRGRSLGRCHNGSD